MTKKKAAAKAAAKKAAKTTSTAPADDAPVDPVVAAEGVPLITSRLLKAGTVIHLFGGKTDIFLKDDVKVEFTDVANDGKFCGMLARHQGNFDLNADQLPGTWSPVTCRREDE